MTDDALRTARTMIRERIAELEARIPRLAPRLISKKMDAIRGMAAEHGLAALEGLADYGAHHALMPGYRQSIRACLEHMDEALLASPTSAAHDREAILAALAVRLH
ncbi:hypothetical protein G7076_11900 [Sphingomonas sp. HDW15A]|uniref:hypothetical protein n=1 Tax=Sphingomonas sp. HDW15A TaxID=2714942 RepID=UPI0014089E4E|nr:hypothetical protein [Sphingomonas sp. HDW15A]QIK97030.1 hypothetical protein G7076_11900 [Sphingomonas sp. HDW15A]